MKPFLIAGFFIAALLCGMLLNASGNNKKQVVIERNSEEITKVEVKRDMHFMPNSLLL